MNLFDRTGCFVCVLFLVPGISSGTLILYRTNDFRTEHVVAAVLVEMEMK
jgi:hypothetical protein